MRRGTSLASLVKNRTGVIGWHREVSEFGVWRCLASRACLVLFAALVFLFRIRQSSKRCLRAVAGLSSARPLRTDARLRSIRASLRAHSTNFSGVKGYSESYSGRIPPSGEAAEAHKRLASAYLIRGHYREALEQINGALAIKPDDGDARGVLQLLTALGESPDQSRGRLQATSLRLLEDGLPVSINGKEATYWFDTGANFSVMSESEAKRIGLKVREVGGSSLVSTGARVSFRLAVADQISLGEAVLRNVAFLVFPDDQPPFNSLSDRAG